MAGPGNPDGNGGPGDGPQPDLQDDLDPGFVDDPPEPDEDDGTPAPDEDIEDTPPEPQAQPQRQSRRDRQSQHWRDRAIEAERSNAAYEARIAALERGTVPRTDPQAEARALQAEYERIGMLPPDQMAASLDGLIQRRVNAGVQQVLDRQDAMAFDQMRRGNPQVAKLAPQVEQMIGALRAQGNYATTREQVVSYLIGQQVLNRTTAATAQQRTAGAARVRAQTTRPANGRGDVPRGSNGAGANSDIELLRQTPIEAFNG